VRSVPSSTGGDRGPWPPEPEGFFLRPGKSVVLLTVQWLSLMRPTILPLDLPRRHRLPLVLVLCLALSGTAAALAAGGPTSVALNAPVVGIAATPDGGGYWLVAADGGVFAHGDAPFRGSEGAQHLNKPVVGMAATPDGQGYWLVGADGGVFAFGDAQFHGSLSGMPLNASIAAIAATPDGRGYWLVGADGGVFAFGDAHFEGSLAAMRLNQPIVGMAPTPTGAGYWLVGADGGVFAFGDAGFHGSLGGRTLNASIVGMTATPTGQGYLLVGGDGGVFTFGDARFYGSTVGQRLNAPVVGIAVTPTGSGYTLAASDGGVFTYGDAQFYGTGNIVTPAPPHPPKPPGPAPPVAGRTVDVTTTTGATLIRTPGTKSLVPVVTPVSVRVGTEIDTTAGQVKLTAAGNAGQPAQSVLLDSGVFTVTQESQAAPSAAPTVVLVLQDVSRCRRRRHGRCSHGPPRLWGNGQGNFRTNGNDSSTTVRGTHWLVEDLRAGTLTVVLRGVVTVHDRARHRTVTVRAGQRYLARRVARRPRRR